MNFKALALCVYTLLLQGCVGIPGAGISSSTDIARDAATLNDAYNRGVSDQILLNVLRARDRWPRQYVNLLQITTQPTLTFSAGLTLHPLPFNNASGPVRDSTLGPISGSSQSAYNYGIAPLSADDVNKLVLTPMLPSVFRRYWEETGWPRDILLLVMVKDAQRYSGADAMADRRVPDSVVSKLMRDEDDAHNWGERVTNWYTSDDAGGGDVCTSNVATPTAEWSNADEPSEEGRCAFFDLIHRLAAVAAHEDDADEALSVHLREDVETCSDVRENMGVAAVDGSAALINALNSTVENAGGRIRVRLREQTPAAPPRSRAAGNASARVRAAQSLSISVVPQNCITDPNVPVLMEVRKGGVVQATYRLRMRSIDDMIYALGTLLRPQDLSHPLRSRSLIRRDCIDDHCTGMALFWATSGDGVDPRQYAARVDYQGHHYVAGPAVGDPGQQENGGDQTASVITLLSQLITLNVQPSTTSPPQRDRTTN